MTPRMNDEGTLNAYKIVACVFPDVPYWCAFKGLTDWSDQKTAEEGDEVDEKVAKALFPRLAEVMKQQRRIYTNY